MLCYTTYRYFCRIYNNRHTGNKHTDPFMLFWKQVWLKLHSCTAQSFLHFVQQPFFLLSILTHSLSLYLMFSCMLPFYEFSIEENGTHKRSQAHIMQAFAIVNIPVTLPLHQHLRVKDGPVVKMLSFLRGEKWCSHDLKDGITQKEHWL